MVQFINERDANLCKLFKDNIIGGSSLIFDRYHKKDIVKINERKLIEEVHLCKKIIGWDNLW